MFNNRAVYEIA